MKRIYLLSIMFACLCSQAQVPCDAPLTINVTNLAPHTATITWTAVSGQTQWWLEYSSLEFHNSPTPIDYLTSKSYTLTNLQEGTNYTVWVGPYCDPNMRRNSENFLAINFTTPVEECPVPTNVTARNIGATNAEISWQGADLNLSYIVRYRRISESDYKAVTTKAHSHVISGLDINTTYSVWVVGVCYGDEKSYPSTPAVDFTTLESNSPCAAMPTNLRVKDITETSARIWWNLANGSDNHWEIYYKKSGSLVTTKEEIKDQNSLPLTGLEPGTTYLYRMRSVCWDDPNPNPPYGNYTNWYSFKTLGVNPHEGIEDVTPSDSPSRGEKILRDGKLYIKINGKTFDATGKEVK